MPLSYRLVKNFKLIKILGCLVILIGCSLNLFSKNLKQNQEEAIMKGPLKISADETISKEHGQIIEASGKVHVNYLMDSGDTLESFSKFARYDEKAGIGELFGNPKAIWKSKDSRYTQTTLTADNIRLKLKGSELFAKGNVIVVQSSNTLTADEIEYSNSEKKMTASGGRPEFDIIEPKQHTKISADEIVAWTEKKQIHFNRKVQGIIILTSEK